MRVSKSKNTLIGLVFACVAVAGGNAAAQSMDVYTWNGLCADCTPLNPMDTPASATLTLQNYTAGDELAAANLVSFSYQSLAFTFSFFADGTASIAGFLPASGSADTPVTLSGLTEATTGVGQFSFTTVGDGSWTLALNGLSFDEHKSGVSSSSWSNDDDEKECATAIPEPESYALLLAGLGLIGYTARRRNRQAA